MEFRHKAREHLRITKLHFENQTYNAFPAACLELRMAIECISYELLNSFKDELDTRLAETWQPGKIIDELKEIDGQVDKDITVHIGFGDAPQEMHLLGTDLRPSASWVKKSYQTLGNFVHERTIAQLKADEDGRDGRARAKFEEILGEAERLLSATSGRQTFV